MGLWNAVKGLVRGYGQQSEQVQAEPPSELRVTITYSGPPAPKVEVSDAEVEERLREYAFVLDSSPPPELKGPARWFDEASQKRRLREKSDKAFAWLLPFLPAEIAGHSALSQCHEWGPNNAQAVVLALRAMVRERRKAKQPTADLVRSLYAAALMADLAKSLEFEGMPVHTMSGYVSMDDLANTKVDYATTGYQAIAALGKTDIKWLVEAFGEPSEHQSVASAWPWVRQNAIQRYCWDELERQNTSRRSLGQPELTMRQWLSDLVRRQLGYYKEWKARCAAAEEQDAERKAQVEAAWAATRVQFAVADLETTGLKPESAEVLELAAVIVEPDGTVVSEFEMLVRPENGVPDEIAKLTGITEGLARSEGKALDEALAAFLAHVGERPLFFHNAPFDSGFLKAAAKRTRKAFKNPVHDTLPIARQAWPGLRTFRLSALAEHVGAPQPRHRALADARATLAVLLAAKRTASG